MRERSLAGLEYLHVVTALLRRVRTAHPTAGLYQAAELQWWWRQLRSTDELRQLFWFDDGGEPAAAAIVTEWGDGTSAVHGRTTLSVVVLPGASDQWVAHVIGRGLAHAAGLGLATVDVEIDRADAVARAALAATDFARTAEGVVVGWLAAGDRPPVSPLAEGYRLRTRAETPHEPYHLERRSGRGTEERLRQSSLYDPTLDLVVHDREGTVAAYGLFWFDPVTATGVVEPMRTEDAHQRRGLARHVLTAGLDRLAAAGAARVSIGWEPANPASGHLYRSVGFVPAMETEILSGPTVTRGA